MQASLMLWRRDLNKVPDGGHPYSETLSFRAGRPDISLTFPAKDVAVRKALESTRFALRMRGLDDDALGTAELVLAEVCNNIVEHAYAGQTGGCIRLKVLCQNNELMCEVSDTGREMPGLRLPKHGNADPMVALADIPEGGFGWGLIHDLTKNLAYRRVAGRNTLRLSLSIQIPA